MDRSGLAEFLRGRRERLSPSDVGLPSGPRRRTPGLRREEIAQVVGMSVDYWSRLEQRRAPQPSDQMLAAVARGLRLSVDERDHLFRLAGREAPRRMRRDEHIAPGLLRVLDRLEDTPALILSDLGETLAQNALATTIFGAERFSGLSRSGVYRWFADPEEARRHYPVREQARQGRLQTAQLRVAASSPDPDPMAADIIAELLPMSSEFRELWALQEVTARFDDRKTLLHPEVGEIEVDCQALFTENQAQVLLVLTPRPGSPADEAMRLLAVVGEQRFTPAE
ncbi:MULTISPECIES: helix-turn-helix transcriptional regulator [unclassified Rathayibacter]|uniref:helix-turn-helix transcriptional regulator n=1 Tax=unclassified Rathayibacter TaxID=2609250 RepID=UPI0007001DDA|nr:MULTISPECIES: helix-turn-helix transcriptional regulator [unclassified Rathayibacter]KQQ00749.1 XRE family transcriptional regulator [Rathayibacter sp. Leaf294]KQS10949.1 XRE family transcriptional regulator [Rathayibacter sp. Leaf185]